MGNITSTINSNVRLLLLGHCPHSLLTLTNNTLKGGISPIFRLTTPVLTHCDKTRENKTGHGMKKDQSIY